MTKPRGRPSQRPPNGKAARQVCPFCDRAVCSISGTVLGLSFRSTRDGTLNTYNARLAHRACIDAAIKEFKESD